MLCMCIEHCKHAVILCCNWLLPDICGPQTCVLLSFEVMHAEPDEFYVCWSVTTRLCTSAHLSSKHLHKVYFWWSGIREQMEPQTDSDRHQQHQADRPKVPAASSLKPYCSVSSSMHDTAMTGLNKQARLIAAPSWQSSVELAYVSSLCGYERGIGHESALVHACDD